MSANKTINDCTCSCFDNHYDFRHEIRKIISVSDKKSSTTYRYINKSGNNTALYRVDGGLIVDDQKCDYLLLNCEKASAFFIEIKGSDVEKAIEQIIASINALRTSLKSRIINARIVPTRVNTTQLNSSKYQRLKKLVSQYNGNLKIQTRLMEETN